MRNTKLEEVFQLIIVLVGLGEIGDVIGAYNIVQVDRKIVAILWVL